MRHLVWVMGARDWHAIVTGGITFDNLTLENGSYLECRIQDR